MKITDNSAFQIHFFNKAVRLCKNYFMARRTSGYLKSKAWAAICMLLIQALLPAFVYATVSKGSTLAEVCTAFGIKKIAPHDGGTADTAGQGKHCPVCALTQLFALPPDHSVVQAHTVAVFDLAFPVANPAYATPRLFPFLRGPPAHA
ncbi:MAG TPA: DUF2946 family protein [Noviherbaspirillum sp.]